MSDEINQNTDLKTVVSEEVSAQTLPEPIQAEIKNDDSTSPADFVLAKSDREVVSEEIKFNTFHCMRHEMRNVNIFGIQIGKKYNI